MTSKKGKGFHVVFSQTLGAIFAQIFRDFAQIFLPRIFDKSKFWGYAFTSSIPASYTTVYI